MEKYGNEQFLYRHIFDKDTVPFLLEVIDRELQCLPRRAGQSHMPPMLQLLFTLRLIWTMLQEQ